MEVKILKNCVRQHVIKCKAALPLGSHISILLHKSCWHLGKGVAAYPISEDTLDGLRAVLIQCQDFCNLVGGSGFFDMPPRGQW